MTMRMDATREALGLLVVLDIHRQRREAALAEVEEWELRNSQIDDLVGFRNAWKVRAEAAEAERDKLKEALERIAVMEPVKPLEHQEFLGGAYLPHGPVVGGARAALAAPGNTT